MAIRLVLAATHHLVLRTLDLFLGREPDFEVLACCRNGGETLHAVRQHQPDVLILDIPMDGNNELAVLRELRQEALPTRVVVLTGAPQEENVLEALRLGASEVVPKEDAAKALVQCVRKVYSGKQWLERPFISRALAEKVRYEASAGDQKLVAETKPIQVFLCHASEDRAAVLEMYDQLKTLGYKPWLDKKDLLPGQRWRVEIPRAIRASDFILIFLSKTSVAKRGYVQKEFKLALDILEEIPEGTIYVIPVRLDDCPIPGQFSDLHWCNLFEADGFETLLRALPSSG